MLQQIYKLFMPVACPKFGVKQITIIRHNSTAVKRRFYKSVSVSCCDDNNTEFEVCLDHRKLRTPGGKVLHLPSHALALAVAQEWASVDEKIQTNLMHITGLCCTVQDNPSNTSCEQMTQKLVDHLDGDTILYPVDVPAELAERQRAGWTPVVEWFSQRFKAPLECSCGDSLMPSVSAEASTALHQHLSTFDRWQLTGFTFAAEAVRSTLLALAALEQHLDASQVTVLSRLEFDYQAEVWGRVAWSHDVDSLDTETRVAAGLLVARLSADVQHSVRCKQTCV